MKKIIFIWCLIFAQATAIEAQTQQQIRQILDKTAATVCKKSGTTAKFTIEVEKQGKTSGEILLKGKMFRIKGTDNEIVDAIRKHLILMLI